MRRWLFKIVLQNQTVGTHLNSMVFVWYACVMYCELQFNWHRSSVGCLHDIIGLAHQWICRRGERLSFAIGILVDKLARWQAKCAVSLRNQPFSLVSSLVE